MDSAEVAKLLHIHPKTLQRMDVPTVFLGAYHLRTAAFSAFELDQWLRIAES
jgi:hypothetical protein